MKNYAILIFICLVTISCNKQTNDFKVPIVSDSGIKPTIIDGTLSFESIKELKETWDYLSKLSINERKKWEETHGFYSIERRIYEEITKNPSNGGFCLHNRSFIFLAIPYIILE